jgi:excisionase family DNA binding protein
VTDNEPVRSRGGVAPFGYRWRDGRLEIDENEAPIRRQIFDLFLKHRRKKTVAKILNDLGYRTRSKAKFSDMAIDRLLRDTTAKGIRDEGGTQVQVDPIVAKDIWERANHLLGARERKQPVNTFAGRVRCSCGGGHMSVLSQSNKYVCAQCRWKIPLDDLEYIFVSQIGSFSFGEHRLGDRWSLLSENNKRLLVEHLCEEIVVARESIAIRSSSDPASFKTPALEQRVEPGNETPDAALPENVGIIQSTEPLLSEAEAAHFLGVSKMTMLRKRKAGIIGFYRVGFRVLYSKEKHLLPFLTNCEKGSSQS